MAENKFKIMLSGGGTGGSVTPILAIAQEFYHQYHNSTFVFVGTHFGPEKMLVEEVEDKLPIKFIPMLAGKWRRYFSFKNFLDFFNIGAAWFQAIYIIKKERPAAVISAGAFVSVPLVWAAKWLKVPVLIHQQDMRPGLANRLMAPAAQVVTVTFSNSLRVYGKKAILTGNPYFLPALPSKKSVFKKYNLDVNRPLTLIFGGGTGSVAINQAIFSNLDDLLPITQIIHISGQGKSLTESKPGYLSLEFLNHNDLLAVMSASDLVISRPGLGTLTELSALKKVSVLVPMPNTHQEDNAQACAAAGAAIYIEQKDLSNKITRLIDNLLKSAKRQAELKDKMAEIIKSGAAETIVDLVIKMIN